MDQVTQPKINKVLALEHWKGYVALPRTTTMFDSTTKGPILQLHMHETLRHDELFA